MQLLYNAKHKNVSSFIYSIALHIFVILVALELSFLFKAHMQAKIIRLAPISLELLSMEEVAEELTTNAVLPKSNIEGNTVPTREKMISNIVLGQIEGINSEINIKRIDVELVITREGRLIDFAFNLNPPDIALEQQLIEMFSHADIVFPKSDEGKAHQTYRLTVIGR